MAWLRARPKTKQGLLHPRAKQYEDNGEPLPLPENPAPELAALLFRAGPGMATREGDTPLTAQELTAWLTACREQVTRWEFETLLALSHAYIQQRFDAANPACPAPWITPVDATKVNRPKIARRIKNLLRS